MTKQEIIQKARESYNKYFNDVEPRVETIDRHDIVLDGAKIKQQIQDMNPNCKQKVELR
ncbi:MAG: hypothetical protein LUF02_04585 [Erysipelotrichaceae bacterium]|nr:hypothetical protein [Erysipelotrichaceae bacterium]